MRRRLISLVGCVVCLAAGTAWTACLEYVGGLPYVPHGWATTVAASGSFAYYNSGPVLYAVDVSSPENPQLAGEVTLPGDIAGIAVDGSIAYVAMGAAGLCTVEVSDPSSPAVLFCQDAMGESSDVTVSGRYLYLAAGWGGLGVFDLAVPEHPVQVGRYTTGGRASGVSVAHFASGTYAYVAAMKAGLRVIDVSTPSAPIEVASVDPGNRYEFITDVAVSGGYAFVADSWEGLRVFDISTPSSTVEVGRCAECGVYIPTSVVVSGTTAYVAGGAVRAADVSVPAAPEVVGDNGCWAVAHDMAVAGGYVLVAHSDEGLSIFRECDGGPVDFGSIDCDQPLVPVTYESFIPAASVATGARGALFQTDVDISNTGDEEARVTFAWLPRGRDNPDPLVSADYVLAAGESHYFENALAEIFRLGPGSSGALRLTSNSDSVIAMSRIHSVAVGETGSFGQGMPAIAVRDMIARGERRRITLLCEDANERANVGCVNGTDRPVVINIGIHDSAGAELEVRTMRLGPYANDQINRLFQPWQPMRGYVDVWSDTAGALFTCYGSVVDNLTNDPTTVPPQ